MMTQSGGARSYILKVAIFATGLSGIVAEYILATMANYFLGDSVTQWALVISCMLFAMGIGSRASKLVKINLLEWFIIIEFTLSIFVASSSLLVYAGAKYTVHRALIIYAQCFITGFLIGMEIPLVTRINEAYETLRENIASVLSLDYIGSLVGGLLFAFICVPVIGLTYTPFIFSVVNLGVAILLFVMLSRMVKMKMKRTVITYLFVSIAFIATGAIFAEKITFWGDQARYKDKIVYYKQSKYQKIVITQWKHHYWLYLNGHQQLSTFDEWHYHEPLVHPAMSMVPQAKNILVLGGGDGCAVREILQYPSVEKVTMVDLDSVVTNLGKTHEVFLSWNHGVMNDPRVEIVNQDGFTWLEQQLDFYDVIIVDLPDPRTIDINKLYTQEFYTLCHRRLRPNGTIITQSGSPYYATKAFKCINKTMTEAGFATVPLHHHVLSLGEWGWNIGCKNTDADTFKKRLQSLKFDHIKTKWLNHEAMSLLTSFGGDYEPVFHVETNTIANPILYQYYLDGNWALY